MNKYLIGVAAAVLAASVFTNANAASVTNTASGSVAVVGAECCPQGQVFNNIILDAAANRSNYVVFDLSPLAAQLAGQDVGSATLTFTAPGFYSSPDATESLTLWDFTGNLAALKSYSFSNPPSATDAAAIRQDLRSGISYGSTVISKPTSGGLTNISITLNAAAIAALNNTLDSANLLFAIGGFSDTLTGNQLLFQTSGGGARLDVDPVPLPGAVWLFGTALLGWGATRWRKRAAA